MNNLDTIKSQMKSQVYKSGYGLHDAYWLGFYEFFGEVLGLKCVDKLRGLMNLSKSCGWFWPFKDVVILTEKPVKLVRDDRGRLHCPDGAAIQYSDGFGVYAWHGTRVDKDIILHPESITVQQIESQTNAELRRILIERYGVERFVVDSGAELFQSDQYGSLYRKTMPDDEPIVMVKVINSTPEGTYELDGWFNSTGQRIVDSKQADMLETYWKESAEEPAGYERKMKFVPEMRDGKPYLKEYFLRVPPTMTTAHEAVAWTFGLQPSEYNPDVET